MGFTWAAGRPSSGENRIDDHAHVGDVGTRARLASITRQMVGRVSQLAGRFSHRRPPTLGSVASGRNNNLNLIRMMAAAAVIITHAYPITQGPGVLQPLEAKTGVTIGVMGLYAFFAISGFLIADSFQRSRTLWHFVAARFLRLYPALVVVLLLTVLVLGPATTTLAASEYFRSSGTLTYVPFNLSLAFLQYELPGVFLTNPNPGPINGSLWTLVHEVACYTGLAVLGLLGVLTHRWRLAGALLLYGAFWVSVTIVGVSTSASLVLLSELSLPFVIGATLYCLKDRIRLSWLVLAMLVVLVNITGQQLDGRLAVVAAISYGVFVVGHRVKGPVLRYNRLGDYSYGTYIYGYPVQQTLVWIIPGMTALANWVMSLVVAVGLAAVSWHVVEMPSLARKNALGAKLASIAAARSTGRASRGSRPATDGSLPAPWS